MRQFITDYWLTLLISLATLGVLIWTGTVVLDLLDSVDEIYVQDEIVLPTAIPKPTPTEIPLPMKYHDAE